MTLLTNVLVLGSRGFIGSRIVSDLRANGVCTFGTSHLSLEESRQEFYFDIFAESAEEDLRKAIQSSRPQQIVNCIGFGVTPTTRVGSDGPPMASLERMVRILKDGLCESSVFDYSLVHLTSALEPVDDQEHFYASICRAQTQLFVDSFRPDVLNILRLPKVIGPGEPRGRFLSDLIAQLAEQREVTVNEPCRQRSILGLADLSTLIQSFVSSGSTTYTSPHVITNAELSTLVAKSMGVAEQLIKVHHEPPPAGISCQLCRMPESNENVVLRGKDRKDSINISRTSIEEIISTIVSNGGVNSWLNG